MKSNKKEGKKVRKIEEYRKKGTEVSLKEI